MTPCPFCRENEVGLPWSLDESLVAAEINSFAASGHVSSVSLSSEFFVVVVFRMVSLTVATSPVGSAACASTSLTVLVAADRGTNECRGPFLPICR